MKKIVALLILALLLPVGALASDPNDKLAEKIFIETFSPFCPGRTLADCPSSAASDLKKDIRAKIAAGATEQEIKSYLSGLYGDGISALPAYSGFGVVAWIAPFGFLLIGLVGALIWLSLKRQAPLPEQPRALSDGEIDLLSRELDS